MNQDTTSNVTLASLREVLAGEPGPATWDALCVVLDSAHDNALPIAVDYAKQHLATWPSAPDAELSTRHGLYRKRYHRTAPTHWGQALCQGEASPRFELIESLSFDEVPCSEAMLCRALHNAGLSQLRHLDIGAHQASPELYDALFRSSHFGKLSHLTLREIPPTGELPDTLSALSTITFNTVGRGYGSSYNAGHDLTFEAKWWPRIKAIGLCSHAANTVLGKIVYAAFKGYLPALRTLALVSPYELDLLRRSPLFTQLRQLALPAVRRPHDPDFASYLALLGDFVSSPDCNLEVLSVGIRHFTTHLGRIDTPATNATYALMDHLRTLTSAGRLKRLIWSEALLQDVARKTQFRAWAHAQHITIEDDGYVPTPLLNT